MKQQVLNNHAEDHAIIGADPIPPGQWHYVGEAGEPAFQNGWDNVGGDAQPLRFRLSNEDAVDIEGEVTGGTDATAVVTLPAPWQPAADIHTPGVGGTWLFQADGQLIFTADSGGSPTGAAGGALDGTYPNPGLAASVAGAGLAETADVLSVNVDGSTIEINTDTLRVKADGITANEIAAGAVTESELSLSDVTTDDVTSTKHGFAPKSPADATKFLNGAATPAYALVTDSDLSTSDITTNNVSTSKHGFAPKLPNDASKFLDGTGAYSTPAGGAAVGALVISSSHSTPLVFDDITQTSAGDDFIYASP